MHSGALRLRFLLPGTEDHPMGHHQATGSPLDKKAELLRCRRRHWVDPLQLSFDVKVHKSFWTRHKQPNKNCGARLVFGLWN